MVMRTRNRFSLPLALVLCALLCLAVSCQSAVKVRHLVPARVDLSAYRDIAVLPTDTGFSWRSHPDIYFDDLDRYLSSGTYEGRGSVGEYATIRLQETLSGTGYFRLVSPSDAKATIQLHIDYLRIDETPRVRSIVEDRTVMVNGQSKHVKVEVGSEYSIEQDVSLGVSWVVRDRQSGRTLATDSYSASRRNTTLVGRRTYLADGYTDTRLWSSFRAPSVMGPVRSMIDSFQGRIALVLAPSWRTERVPLLAIKDHQGAKNAAKMADKGLLEEAYQAYLEIWKEEGNERAGANAALLREAQGKLDEALSLIGQVAAGTGDKEVRKLQERLTSYAASHREALRQWEGT